MTLMVEVVRVGNHKSTQPIDYDDDYRFFHLKHYSLIMVVMEWGRSKTHDSLIMIAREGVEITNRHI